MDITWNNDQKDNMKMTLYCYFSDCIVWSRKCHHVYYGKKTDNYLIIITFMWTNFIFILPSIQSIGMTSLNAIYTIYLKYAHYIWDTLTYIQCYLNHQKFEIHITSNRYLDIAHCPAWIGIIINNLIMTNDVWDSKNYVSWEVLIWYYGTAWIKRSTNV